MMNKLAISVVFSAGLALSACGPTPQALTPSPLVPAPVAPVAATGLPPATTQPSLDPSAEGANPSDPLNASTAVATVGQPGGDLQALPELPDASNTGVTSSQNVSVGPNIDFGRNAVLGAWNVAAVQDVCALNLSLTTWTGGFRASTRKCTEETLANIGAWSLTGKQLTLFNSQGDNIARLVASGPNRFDGTTSAGGKAISVFR